MEDTLAVERTAEYTRQSLWVDIYYVLKYGKWPLGLLCAIGGNYIASISVIDNGSPVELNKSDEEEGNQGNW